MGGDSSRVTDEATSTSPVQKPDLSYGRQGLGIHIPMCHTTPPPAHRTLLGHRRQKNEIVFRHLFPAGQAATRELLQRLRTEAHSAIRKRLGMNLFYTDAHGDTIKVVTKKSDHGDWTTTWDIRVHFSSARAATIAYEQQRNQNLTRGTQAGRLFS